MKILQINKFYYRRRGAEAYFLDLCDLLKQNNHEVAVFSMEHPKNLKTPYSEYFVSNVELSKVKLNFKAARRLFWSYEAKKKITQLIKEFKPDIAHIHNIYHQISPSILSALKKAKIPIVQTLHDYKLLCPNYKMFTQGKICERCRGHCFYNCAKHRCIKNSLPASALVSAEMYFHNFLQVYQKDIDCFISPSIFLRNKVLDWGTKIKRIEVINNFVNTVETQNFASVQGNYILYFGGLSEEKGIDLLIDNFSKLNYDIELHILGTGVSEQGLKQKAKPNKKIKFLGHLQGKELAEKISHCKFVILPSQWYENYPISACEAMSYQKPVIASNLGGIPEIVKDKETGLLFDIQDKNALTNKIKFLLDKPELISELGVNARKFIEQNLNAELHYQKIIKLYDEVIADN